MSEKLQDLFQLLIFSMRLSEVSNGTKHFDLSPIASHLLSKANLVQAMNISLLRDISEKFLAERHGIAFGKTRVQIVSETGCSTAPFILSGAALHPVTRFTPELQPHSPMVFDLWGQVDTPGVYLHGQDNYYELQETKGDILLICPDQP